MENLEDGITRPGEDFIVTEPIELLESVFRTYTSPYSRDVVEKQYLTMLC